MGWDWMFGRNRGEGGGWRLRGRRGKGERGGFFSRGHETGWKGWFWLRCR